jgi:hypothetical protein
MRSRSSKSSPALSLIEGNAFSNQIVGQLEARPLEANDPMLLMLIGASQGATAGIHWAIPNPPMSTLSSRPSHQFAITSGFRLSAILRKPSPGIAATAPNPHRRSSAHPFPGGSFFGGCRTPALYRVDHSCSGRHPKPFPISAVRCGSGQGVRSTRLRHSARKGTRRRCSHRVTFRRLEDLPVPPKPPSVDPGRPSKS